MDGKGKEVREKPHRMPREFYVGKVLVSFTMCAQGKRPLFASHDTVGAMVDILGRVAIAKNCALPVYCFMPDHLHWVAEGRSDESDLWSAAVEFKQRSGYWLYANKVEARWQKDFHDHIIRKCEDLRAHIVYILENPVRRGIAADWRKYAFSGCLGYKSLDEVLSLL